MNRQWEILSVLSSFRIFHYSNKIYGARFEVLSAAIFAYTYDVPWNPNIVINEYKVPAKKIPSELHRRWTANSWAISL
jgi:hypothetical protein